METVAIDIETTGLSWADRVLVVGAAWRESDSTAISSDSSLLVASDLFSTTNTIPQTRTWLSKLIDGADWLVLHNASFDLPYLFSLGVLQPEDVAGRVFDTLVMAACTGGHDSHSLAALCSEYGIKSSENWKEMKKFRNKMGKMLPSEVTQYCEQDCVATLKLFDKLIEPSMALYDRKFIANEGDYCTLLAKMRLRGIALNVPFIQNRITEDRDKAKMLQLLLFANGIEAPNHRAGLLEFLERTDWKPKVLTPKGEPSLNREALELAVKEMSKEEDRAVLEAVLTARNLEKEDSTFLTGFLEQMDDGQRIHPCFFNGGTRTWRLSSSVPNAQNIPRVIKNDLFQASEPGGCLVEMDYSQAQLRLAAMYAKEKQMAKVFQDPNGDIHLATAIALFGPVEGLTRRKEGKSANFAVLFGSGAEGVANVFKLDLEVAESLLYEHKRKFPALGACAREVGRRWLERGYIVLPYGKRSYSKPSDDPNKSYVAWNYLIQGAEGVIIQRAMQMLDAEGFTIVSQVHDSVYLDVAPGDDPEAVARRASEIMRDAAPATLCNRPTPPISMTTDYKIIKRAEGKDATPTPE